MDASYWMRATGCELLRRKEYVKSMHSAASRVRWAVSLDCLIFGSVEDTIGPADLGRDSTNFIMRESASLGDNASYEMCWYVLEVDVAGCDSHN